VVTVKDARTGELEDDVAGWGAPKTFVDWTSYEVPAAYPSESAAYRPNSTTPPMEICVAMYTES
jgi:hypothetical protein